MRKWVILVLLLVVIALSGVFAVNRVARSKPIVVSVATIREEPGGSAGSSTVLNASGYVMPRREATVSAKMTGKVIEVLAEEGKRVEAGQILARLDDSNIKANHKLAGAQLAASRAALGEAEASLKEASANHRRVEALILEKIETPAGLDRAEAALRIAEARVATQRANIAAAEQGLAVWTQQLEDTIIRAPFSGIVTAKNAQPGETISPMSSGGFTRTGICTLVDMTSLEIEVDVNESFIERVFPGQPVEATLDAYSSWKIPAKVIAIIPTADRQKATVKVRVGFEQLDPRILPQMGVKTAFRASATSPGDQAPAAPRRWVQAAAVQTLQGRSLAWLVRDGRAERRSVQTGTRQGSEIEIVGGLSPGDRVIMTPPSELTEGTRVQEKQ